MNDHIHIRILTLVGRKSSHDGHGADGNVHLAFYDESRSLSFVWSGNLSDYIEVAYGGYGESVFAEISGAVVTSVQGPLTVPQAREVLENVATIVGIDWDNDYAVRVHAARVTHPSHFTLDLVPSV